jgi:hypothetical protein
MVEWATILQISITEFTVHKGKVLGANAQSIQETSAVGYLHGGNHGRQIGNMVYENA